MFKMLNKTVFNRIPFNVALLVLFESKYNELEIPTIKMLYYISGTITVCDKEAPVFFSLPKNKFIKAFMVKNIVYSFNN